MDQNSGFHGNRTPPLTYNGENDVSTFSRLLLIRSFLYLQVTRTCIKSRTCSNFGQIGPLTTELAGLEGLKNSHRLIMGKCCLHASSFIFYPIIIKLLVIRTGIKARTSLILGRIRLLTLELLTLEWRKFYTFELESLWGQLANLDQILCVASFGLGKGCIMFKAKWIKTLVSMATERPHWLIMGKMMSPPFLGCFWSDPFYTCR